VVLEHIAQYARTFIVARSPLDAYRFGCGDLYVIDVVAIPQWLPDRVGKPEGEDVLDRFLAQVVIDAVDLALVEHLVDLPVQVLRAWQIVPEGLFDDDARKPAATIQPCVTELFDHDRVKLRRHGEIIEPVAPGAVLAVKIVQQFREPDVGLRIIVLAATVVEVLGECVPPGRFSTADARVLEARCAQVVAKSCVAIFGIARTQLAASHTDDRELIAELAFNIQRVE